jgi:hypothetical protein
MQVGSHWSCCAYCPAPSGVHQEKNLGRGRPGRPPNSIELKELVWWKSRGFFLWKSWKIKRTYGFSYQIYIITSQAILALKGRKSRGFLGILFSTVSINIWDMKTRPKMMCGMNRSTGLIIPPWKLGSIDVPPVPDHCLNSPVVMANTGWCFQTLSQYWFLRNSLNF